MLAYFNATTTDNARLKFHCSLYSLQRKIVQGLRYADEQAKRTQPPPDIPGGPYHKTSQIYYYLRDARREVQQPMLIAGSKQIGTEKKPLTDQKYITPGKTYNF
ncbi:NADH dehydrogenase [ubiquinone] 1 alpha subcomplex subunit 7-like [Temnothorax curvispinosus]|uniref:NADH dehydrogenase [ubiquinone] 1 alpha subcomplex subunit 7 n=1 Tax=Temnothorax curvispinosus TaxID=300111 RepID=A0A6J1QHK0_9HYME|nr:NADH dehydrogenase [ubiquinone] 1 alpha subcomplex subunit 7-like [Temnothorax curvispinosus]